MAYFSQKLDPFIYWPFPNVFTPQQNPLKVDGIDKDINEKNN